MKDKTINEIIFDLQERITQCKDMRDVKDAVMDIAIKDAESFIPDDYIVKFSKIKELLKEQVKCVEDRDRQCKICGNLTHCRFIAFMANITQLISDLVSIPSDIEIGGWDLSSPLDKHIIQ